MMKMTGRAGGLLLAPVGLALVLAACNSGPSEAELARDAAMAETTRLRGELLMRDSLIGEMTLSFDEIERNIALMDEREKLIADAGNEELGMDKRRKIVRDLQLMNGLMNDSRERIAELTKRLDKSKIEASGLRKRLKDLDLQLAQRDSAMTNMKDELLARDFKIDQINEQLSAIELEVAKREAIIQQQEHEINKAYVAMGTYKDLEAQGVLVKQGGVVGIGQRTNISDDARASQFQEVDVRELRKLPLSGDKAKLVTDHPKKSYDIVEAGDELAYLEIKDPQEFWKLSKYLVVEVR